MPRDVGLEITQGYFDVKDVNKNLIFNAFTPEQLEKALNFQEHLDSIIKDLYVPSYENAT